MPQYFFSPSTKGFYNKEVNGSNIPEDAKAVPYPVYVGLLGKHVVPDGNGDPVEYVTPPKESADIRSELVSAVATKRWDVMVGGITLPNGIRIDTSEVSLNRITQTVANAHHAGFSDDFVVSFKSLSGFIRITIGNIRDIGGMIGRHMQLCFDAERLHNEAIEATNDADLLSYNINTLWPDN